MVFYEKQPTYNPELIPYAKDTQRKSKWIKGTQKRTKDGQYQDVKMIEDIHARKGALPINIIQFKLEQNNQHKKQVFHPTQKPVALMEYLIKTYTHEGETVLDFTMGSGTTGIAAKNLNRNFIGIELDEEYFKLTKDRINNHVVQQEML